MVSKDCVAAIEAPLKSWEEVLLSAVIIEGLKDWTWIGSEKVREAVPASRSIVYESSWGDVVSETSVVGTVPADEGMIILPLMSVTAPLSTKRMQFDLAVQTWGSALMALSADCDRDRYRDRVKLSPVTTELERL